MTPQDWQPHSEQPAAGGGHGPSHDVSRDDASRDDALRDDVSLDHASLDHVSDDHVALDHVGIAVAALDAASAPYLALGLAPLADEEVAGQGVRVRAFDAGNGLVELLASTRADGPIGRFLERRGPGLHHVAFRTTDLDATVATLQATGARFVDPTPHPGRAGTRAVFLHPSWGAGVLIELVEHA